LRGHSRDLAVGRVLGLDWPGLHRLPTHLDHLELALPRLHVQKHHLLLELALVLDVVQIYLSTIQFALAFVPLDIPLECMCDFRS